MAIALIVAGTLALVTQLDRGRGQEGEVFIGPGIHGQAVKLMKRLPRNASARGLRATG